MRYLRLSYDLTMDLPVPPDLPGPRLDHIRDMGGRHIQRLCPARHHSRLHSRGRPRHFVADGMPIAEFGLDDVTFVRPVICDIPLGDGEIVRPAHLAPHAGRIAGVTCC